MQNNNTVDITNEILEEFSIQYADDYVLQETVKLAVKAGANWQKEKDKANYAKLVECLKELMRFENLFTHVAPELQYPDNFLTAVESAKQLLQTLQP